LSALKVPLRLAGKLALIGLDWVIGKVMDYNARKDAKKAEARATGLTYKDVERISQAGRDAGKCPRCGQVHPSNATCPFRTAHTIIIPRPKP
jgi:hypothetical protein